MAESDKASKPEHGTEPEILRESAVPPDPPLFRPLPGGGSDSGDSEGADSGSSGGEQGDTSGSGGEDSGS
jgi:hypothetical protein